jgi:hypothetical protein
MNGSDNREDGLTEIDWEMVGVSDGRRVRPITARYGQVYPCVPCCWVRSSEYETVEPKSIAQREFEWVYVVQTYAQRCDNGPKKSAQ